MNIDELENNLKKVFNFLDEKCGYGDMSVVDMITSAKIQMKEVSFMQLMEYSDKSLDTENNTFLSDEEWIVMIGYLLFSRCGIDEELYINWVDKQSVGYRYLLMMLIGKEEQKHQEYYEIVLMREYKEQYKIIKNILGALKKPLIKFHETNKELSLLGYGLEIDDCYYQIKDINHRMEEAYKFASNIFRKDFESRCGQYDTCIDNILAVFNNADEALWVKTKTIMSTLGYSDDEMDNMQTDFFSNIDKSSIRDWLIDEYENIRQLAFDEAKQIDKSTQKYNDSQFVVGGNGVGGIILGSVAGNAMVSLRDALSDARMRSNANMFKARVEHIVDELYKGEEVMSMYLEILKNDTSFLKKRIIKKYYPDIDNETIYDTVSYEDNFKRVNDIIIHLSSEETRSLLCAFITAYPDKISSYQLIERAFIGEEDKLRMLAQALQEKEIVDYLSDESRVLNWKDDILIYGNTKVLYGKQERIKIFGIEINHAGYILTFPMNEDFFVNGNIQLGIKEMVSPQQEYIMSSNNGEVLIYWGEIEGKSKFNIERKRTDKEFLAQVSSLNKFKITDFSQATIYYDSPSEHIRLIKINNIAGTIAAGFFLQYITPDIAINIAYGKKSVLGLFTSDFSDYKEKLIDFRAYKIYEEKKEILQGTSIWNIDCLLEEFFKYIPDASEKEEDFTKLDEKTIIIEKGQAFSNVSEGDVETEKEINNSINEEMLIENNTVCHKIMEKNVSMMFCVFCGKKILRNVKFCNYCGKRNNYVGGR